MSFKLNFERLEYRDNPSGFDDGPANSVPPVDPLPPPTQGGPPEPGTPPGPDLPIPPIPPRGGF